MSSVESTDAQSSIIDLGSKYPAQLFLSSLPKGYPPPVILTETRLPTIDPVSLSLHRALHIFKPISDDYATIPYDKAFNWSELKLPEDQEGTWYCVVFRTLYEADILAHNEAIRNGGLIAYWYGVPSKETGENISTCIWQSRAEAEKSARLGEDHKIAMGLAEEAYEFYYVDRHALHKVKGEVGVRLTVIQLGHKPEE